MSLSRQDILYKDFYSRKSFRKFVKKFTDGTFRNLSGFGLLGNWPHFWSPLSESERRTIHKKYSFDDYYTKFGWNTQPEDIPRGAFADGVAVEIHIYEDEGA